MSGDKHEVARADLKQLWENLGVVDGGESGPLMPAKIRHRNAKGDMVEEDVLLAIVPLANKTKARKRARDRARSAGEYDEDKDQDLLAAYEQLETLRYAIVEASEVPSKGGRVDYVYGPKYATVEDMFASVPSELPFHELWAAYDHWATLNDPRYGELSGDDLWALIMEVAAKGPSPLAAIAGREQVAFIVRSAREALLSPNAPLSTQLRSTSPSE